jgi:hypothetical protein
MERDPLDSSEDQALSVSLVRGDALFKLQRRIGLIPPEGLGVARRAIVFALVAWLPVAVWAVVTGHARAAANGESWLQHFGVHVRGLIAIPLLIFAEGSAHRVSTQLIPSFLRTGVVPPSERDRFVSQVQKVVRLRDASYPLVIIVGLLLALAFLLPAAAAFSHEMDWAVETDGSASHLGFAGWWMLCVTRPIFVTLMGAWLWRLVLLSVLLARIARLDLALVPTHPDHLGGLGFVERIPAVFSPVVLALSCVLASRWAHDVLYHDVKVDSLKVLACVFVGAMVIIFLGPLLWLRRPLARTRRRALFDYGVLVGQHGRLVQRRWIDGEPVENEAILSAPELGPVADTAALYDSVAKMRTVPIGKRAILSIAIPALLPILVAFGLQIPIKEMLLKLLKAVV